LNSGVWGDWRLGAARLARALAWIATDAIVVVSAFYVATYIRFVEASANASTTWKTLPLLLVPITFIYLTVTHMWALNERIWRYASGVEVFTIFSAVGFGTLLLLASDLILGTLIHSRLSIAILVMGGFFSATGMVLVRYRWRIVTALVRRHRLNPATRALIYGAGDSGQLVADRMMTRPNDHEYELVGFVDDDRRKRGMRIHGLPVLGSGNDLDLLIDKFRVDVIVLAVANATPEQRQRIIDICNGTRARVKVAPNFFDIVASPTIPLVRELRVSDLLGRSEADVDREECSRVLEDKVVLITGAAGSVGSELCRQIAPFKPRLLVGLDHNESGLYDLAIELKSGPNPVPFSVIVADIRNRRAITSAFQKVCPHIVFHAAAYKHVPLMQEFPEEAVLTNIQGTEVVLDAARRIGAERFVFVSTDKAVRPTSTMGATKRVAEQVAISNEHYGPMLTTAVRFGNVFGSRGSVVPTFARQIQRGGPVTVTHPEMTRFFMEISEAAILIIQAAAMTQGNDIFMLDMGEPVKIDDLARRMIRMRGLRPDVDITIAYTGVRPGEKLHEELIRDGEQTQPTRHPMIRRIDNGRPTRTDLEVSVLYELAQDHQTGAVIVELMRLCRESESVSNNGSKPMPEEFSGTRR
jgi:FlaA1/EpsC-like NDP-sugar epimerase